MADVAPTQRPAEAVTEAPGEVATAPPQPATAPAQPATTEPEDLTQKPLSRLLSDATSDLSTLFRKELELAKVEIKEEVTKAGKAGGMFAGAAVLGNLALLLFAFALAWALAAVMPNGLAFFIVGVLVAAGAAVLFVQGRKRAKQVNPVPEQTVETIKEDIEWAKEQTR